MIGIVLLFLLCLTGGQEITTIQEDGEALCEFYDGLVNKASLTNWCGPKFTNGSFVNGPCSRVSPWTGIFCNRGKVWSLNTGGAQVGGKISPALARITSLSQLTLEGGGFVGAVPDAICNIIPSHDHQATLSMLWIEDNPGITCYPSCLYNLPPSFNFVGDPIHAVCTQSPTPAPSNPTATPTPWPTYKVGGPTPVPTATPTPAPTSQADGDGLILCQVYNAVTPASRYALSGWCGDKAGNGSFVHGPCDPPNSPYSGMKTAWAGVGCSMVGGVKRVVSISLGNIRLTGSSKNSFGTIGSYLGLLTNLKSLDLSTNTLPGTLPSEFFGLSSLTALDLSWLSLSGTIPTLIGQLTSLQFLNLQRNSFDPVFPTEMNQLTQLTSLMLSGTQYWSGGGVSGPLPVFAGLTRLSSLFMSNFNFYAAPDYWDVFIPAHTALTQLYLTGNVMSSATIPPSFASLTNLVELDLQGCSINGPVPSVLGTMTKVHTLDLSKNSFTGTIPLTFCSKPCSAYGATMSFRSNPGLTCYPGCMNQCIWWASSIDSILLHSCPGPPSPSPTRPSPQPSPSPTNPTPNPTPRPSNPSSLPTLAPTSPTARPSAPPASSPTPVPTLPLDAPTATERSGWATVVEFSENSCGADTAVVVVSFALGMCVPFDSGINIGRVLWDAHAEGYDPFFIVAGEAGGGDGTPTVPTQSPTVQVSTGEPTNWSPYGRYQPTAQPTVSPSWAISTYDGAGGGLGSITTRIFTDNSCLIPAFQKSGSSVFPYPGAGVCNVIPNTAEIFVHKNDTEPRSFSQIPSALASFAYNSAALPGTSSGLSYLTILSRDPQCEQEGDVVYALTTSMALVCTVPAWDPVAQVQTRVITKNTVSYNSKSGSVPLPNIKWSLELPRDRANLFSLQFYLVGCTGVGMPQVLLYQKGNCQGPSTAVPLSSAPATIQKNINTALQKKCNPLIKNGRLDGYQLTQVCVLPSPGGWSSSASLSTKELSTDEVGVSVGIGLGVAILVLLLAGSGLLYYWRVYKPNPAAASLASQDQLAQQQQQQQQKHVDDIPQPSLPPPRQSISRVSSSALANHTIDNALGQKRVTLEGHSHLGSDNML